MSMSSNGTLIPLFRLRYAQQTVRLLAPNKLLLNLVRIPSESRHEFRAACFLESRMRSYGIRIKRQHVGKHRFNLIASIGRKDTGPRVLFNTHIDTVPAFSRTELCPKLRCGRLYGRGSCDTKASVVAMTTAFVALSRLPLADCPNLTLAVMVGEEDSGDGVARFIKSRPSFDWAVVGEPTQLGIACTQSGYIEVRVDAKSYPCHGFDPINHQAAIALSQMITECQALCKRLSRKHPHNLFIRSMTAGPDNAFWYTRPLASATILINVFPDATRREVLRELHMLAKQIEKRLVGTKLAITLMEWDNGISTPRNAFSVQSLSRGLSALNIPPRCCHLPSWTDGSTLSDFGIETVIFGPGNLKDAHTSTERVQLSEVEKAASALILACQLGRYSD